MDKTLFVVATVASDTGSLDIDWQHVAMNVAARWKVGQKLMLRVQAFTKRRSIAANNYYWGVIVKTMHECSGHSMLYCHEWLKGMFNSELGYMISESTGEMLERQIPLSTAQLSDKEFAHYVDECEAWVIDFFRAVFPPYAGNRYARSSETA